MAKPTSKRPTMPDLAPYHSANRRPLRPAPAPMSGCAGRAGVAFVHDLMTGPLPDAYRECDVLYADLPWKSGFDEFNRRAGVDDGRTYADFLAAVDTLVHQSGRPAVLTTGKHALGVLQPDATAPVALSWLNRQPGTAALYGLNPPDLPDTTHQLLHWLARRYDCAGDFCCGYGLTGRVFAAARKRYVLSDHNPACIGQIAATAATWTTP
jgi:hypothetical protein